MFKKKNNNNSTDVQTANQDAKDNQKKNDKRPMSRLSLVLSEKTPFNIREAYKSTRTNIVFSLPDKGCKQIIITSAFPKEGKTTTCLNLAITFAEMNAKVLLIDADLRKPRLHKLLKLDGTIALTNVLSGLNAPSEAIQKTEYQNLDVIAAGHVPPNPAEMLASERMKETLAELSQVYDYIFIDTPPINVVTDAMVMATLVSGIYLVVRQNYTDHRSIKDALMKFEIANVKPIGFILNDVDEQANKYKYGYNRYGYRKYGYYYYKYGYSKYGSYGGYGY